MVVMGRTELTRELTTRRLDGWAIRLGMHVHLMPLDLDEARELLAFPGRAGVMRSRSWRRSTAIRWQPPDAAPPRRIEEPADRAGAMTSKALARAAPPEAPEPSNRPAIATPRRPTPKPDVAIRQVSPPEDTDDRQSSFPDPLQAPDPTRGWSGRSRMGRRSGGRAALAGSTRRPAGNLITAQPEHDEEPVEDRYAALQAWTEWTRNRERQPVAGERPDRPDVESADVADTGRPLRRWTEHRSMSIVRCAPSEHPRRILP